MDWPQRRLEDFRARRRVRRLSVETAVYTNWKGGRGWSGISSRFWAGQYALPVRCVWDGLSHILDCGQPVNVDGPAHPRTSTRQTDNTVVANGAHAGHPSLAEGDANVDLMLSTPVKGFGSVLLQFA